MISIYFCDPCRPQYLKDPLTIPPRGILSYPPSRCGLEYQRELWHTPRELGGTPDHKDLKGRRTRGSEGAPNHDWEITVGEIVKRRLLHDVIWMSSLDLFENSIQNVTYRISKAVIGHLTKHVAFMFPKWPHLNFCSLHRKRIIVHSSSTFILHCFIMAKRKISLKKSSMKESDDSYIQSARKLL